MLTGAPGVSIALELVLSISLKHKKCYFYFTKNAYYNTQKKNFEASIVQ